MTARPILFVHSSDELYGSDRMVLRILTALSPADRARAVVWLPTDFDHPQRPLCHELSRLGVDVEHRELPIVRRSYLTAPGLTGLARRRLGVARAVRAVDPELVVLTTSACLPVAGAVPPTSRVALYLQEVWQGPEARVLGLLAARAGRIVAVSQAARQSLPPALRPRCVVVPNSTPDPGECVPPAWGPAPLRFLVASRWSPRKGLEQLLTAWARAGEPGTLLVAGGPPDTGPAVDVPGLVAHLGLQDSVEVLGEVPDLGAVLSAADVAVIPSVQPESFGLVAIEAFARARPVVASDAGGTGETVTPGTGWLVPPGDVAALAERLASLDRRTVSSAGRRARARYETHYAPAVFDDAVRRALGLAA